ncbi:MAG: hypothetical protein GY928_10760 [Colwellia sp.]|nr:hypothetical protein [Colwellia sp.]
MGNSKRLAFLNKHKQEQIEVGVNNNYPKFSFEYCFNGNRGLAKTSAATNKVIMGKIITFSQQRWVDIKALPKASGFEKIEVNQLKSTPNLPKKFEGIDKVDVCRLGRNARLIGYILDDTFYAVWVDTKLDMYDH